MINCLLHLFLSWSLKCLNNILHMWSWPHINYAIILILIFDWLSQNLTLNLFLMLSCAWILSFVFFVSNWPDFCVFDFVYVISFEYYFFSRFDGRVVAKLPFTPISLMQGLSHRNLGGDDYTHCSFIFLYILCTMSIRQVRMNTDFVLSWLLSLKTILWLNLCAIFIGSVHQNREIVYL